MHPITRLFFLFLAGVSFSNAWASEQSPDPTAALPPKGKIPTNLLYLDGAPTHPKYSFIADKSQRTLTVWSNKSGHIELYGAFPMDIGKRGGDKQFEGDHKTPEGIYFFQTQLDGDKLNFSEYGKRAFTLDYPNIFDKHFGKGGKGIWLHAIPETKSLLRGSRGCVVVRNEIIEQLTPLIELDKTPMIILDQVSYVDAKELNSPRDSVQAWIKKWKTTWESKNLAEYMTFYSEAFYSMKMNRNQWQKYKEKLNDKYEYIRVEVKAPLILTRHEDTLIKFVQQYESNGLNDIGEKSLYIRKSSDGDIKIMAEKWQPISSEIKATMSAAKF